jgi:hypothetical protein
MAHPVGERVGVIAGSNKDGSIDFLGWGTYLGFQKVGPEAAGVMAEVMREINGDNPCIELDSGERVWGCECWWGKEESVKKILTQHKVIHNVALADFRKRALAPTPRL